MMEETFDGIYTEKNELYTVNAVPGEQVYGERLVEREGTEYRHWDATRSKLGAAIRNGLPQMPIKKGSRILYLGAASGTTPSHIADIAQDGIVFGVEYSPKVVRDLLTLSKQRETIAPILGDARRPEQYSGLVDTVDVVFQDVAQPDQFRIVKKNTDMFLADDGYALVAIKARSISSSRSVKDVFDEQREKFGKVFDIVWESRLEPFEDDHLFLLLQPSR